MNRPTLTLPTMLDTLRRALTVIETSDGADEHAELLSALREAVGVCEDASMTAGELTLPTWEVDDRQEDRPPTEVSSKGGNR